MGLFSRLKKWLFGEKEEEIITRNVKASGVQRVVVEGKDWGPAITKVLIELNGYEVTAYTFDKDSFVVTENSNGTISNRIIMDAYISDNKGRRLEEGKSNYIALELYVSPEIGLAMTFDPVQMTNCWCPNYSLETNLAEGVTITVNQQFIITGLYMNKKVDLNNRFQRICLDMEAFVCKETEDYHYAYYKPATRKESYPLVIWLHGGGEGGEDVSKAILGNRVTALIHDDFQSLFDGAYVLVPQCKTAWMADETGVYQEKLVHSIFTKSLMKLIKNFVEEHPIDKNQILVGGCSNGGYMTIQMIIEYPEYFAGAFPICEGFRDTNITSQQIQALADSKMGIYFTYCIEDEVLNYKKCTLPTYERLRKQNARTYLAEFAEVTEEYENEQGETYSYKYNGHFSWVKFFNNECHQFFEQLSQERKGIEKAES